MTIIYRAEKGSPLTSNEIDNNFKELETRIKTLEDHQETVESLGNIQIRGDQVTFTGTFGTDFGTFSLPKATLKPCGLWVSQHPYQTLDVVTFENTLYSCLKNHISSSWPQDSPYWQEILSFPHSSSPVFPLYEKDRLPEKASLGKLALLMEEGEQTLIFFNGNAWQRLMKGAPL